MTFSELIALYMNASKKISMYKYLFRTEKYYWKSTAKVRFSVSGFVIDTFMVPSVSVGRLITEKTAGYSVTSVTGASTFPLDTSATVSTGIAFALPEVDDITVDPVAFIVKE